MITTSHPLQTFTADKLDFFFEHAKRLRSKEPLEQFKAIFDAYRRIQETLGDLEHEVGLDVIKSELKLVRRDIWDGVKQSFRNFRHLRTLAATQAKAEQESRRTGERELADMKAGIEELREIDPSMANDAEAFYDECVQLNKGDFRFASAWRAASWTFLWVESKLLAVYIGYLFMRIRVFLQFHAFIFLIPILLMGIGYSLVSKSAIEAVSTLSPSSLWLGPALLIGVYAIKKYVIDKKLKAMQKRLETRLYIPLSARLFLARTLALQVRTLRR